MHPWLERLWYVQAPLALTVQADAHACLAALALAARPSQQRLHLRNLFTEGRRYQVEPRGLTGFRVTTTSALFWSRRARARVAGVVLGELMPAGDGATRVLLRARMGYLYTADILLVPLFMTSLLVFAPWNPLLIAGLSATLFGLSFAWHRLSASLQAADGFFFVQKALEDFTPLEAPALAAAIDDSVDGAAFRAAWSKFYARQQGDSPEADADQEA